MPRSLQPSFNVKSMLRHLGVAGDYLAQFISQAGGTRTVFGSAQTPTTASTQATGAGALNIRVNMSQTLVLIDGLLGDLAATNDVVVFTNGTSPVANGQSMVVTTVVKKVAAVFSLVHVAGTAAATGSQVAPTDTAIATAVTGGASWVKLWNVNFDRTGDINTFTQTQLNSAGDRGPYIF